MGTNKLNILHFFGGVRAYKMARSLAENNFNIFQVTMESTKNFMDYLNHKNIRLFTKYANTYSKLKGKRWFGIFKLHFILYPLFITVAANLIRKNKIGFVHAHRHTGAAIILLAKKLFWLKVKVLFDYHDPLEIEDVQNPSILRKLLILIFYKFEGWVCKNSDFILTQGEEHTALLQKRYSITNNKINHIYNPVDIAVYKPQRSKTIKTKYKLSNNTVLFLGSIVESFGIHNLILAAPKIVSEIKNVKFAIRGVVQDQNYDSRLKNMIKEGNLSEYFVWLPYVETNELVKVISSCEIGVILHVKGSLITETAIPNKIFEYMACGIPTVANNLPNLHRFILDGYSGVICNTDNPDELAKAIITLLKNREKTAKIGRNARKLANRKYNWAIESNKLIGIYRSINENFDVA